MLGALSNTPQLRPRLPTPPLPTPPPSLLPRPLLKSGSKQHAVSEAEVDTMFTAIDGDGDGHITLEEFALFAKVMVGGVW